MSSRITIGKKQRNWVSKSLCVYMPISMVWSEGQDHRSRYFRLSHLLDKRPSDAKLGLGTVYTGSLLSSTRHSESFKVCYYNHHTPNRSFGEDILEPCLKKRTECRERQNFS